jgi:GR25 family glycosyltransferase involved in LPS biosynthesis
MDKLAGMPNIYYINLDRSPDRNQETINNFNKFSINKYTRVSAIDYKDQDLSRYSDLGLTNQEIAVLLSHMKAVEQFVSSGEEWAIICEDDVEFDTAQHWQFSWLDFFKYLPKNADIVQLVISTRNSMDIDFQLHHRKFWDFGAVAYLINTKRANDLIAYYKPDGYFNFKKYKKTYVYDKENHEFFKTMKYPTSEEILYTLNNENSYSFPLFSYAPEKTSLVHNHESQHEFSRNRVYQFWRERSKNFTLEDLMKVNI